MNKKTIERLKKNPFYKPSPGQLIPDDDEVNENEKIRTFGVPPAVHTVIPKHPTDPKTVVHKKQIDK